MTANSYSGAPGSGLFAQYCTELRGQSSCFASRLGLRRLAELMKDSEHGLCFGCFIQSQPGLLIPVPKECEDSGLWQCSWSKNIVFLVATCAGWVKQDLELDLAAARVLPCTDIGLQLAHPSDQCLKDHHLGHHVGETSLWTRSRQD